MIDVTDALAGIVAEFEETIHRLREEAEASADEPAPAPITFVSAHDDPDDEFWPPPIVLPANELRPPAQVRVDKSGLDEDEIFRWQRWRQ